MVTSSKSNIDTGTDQHTVINFRVSSFWSFTSLCGVYTVCNLLTILPLYG